MLEPSPLHQDNHFAAFAVETHMISQDKDKHPILLTKARGEHADLKYILDYDELLLKSHPIQVDFDLQGPPSSEQQFMHEVTAVKPTEASTKFLCY